MAPKKNLSPTRILTHPIVLFLGFVSAVIGIWQFAYKPIQERSLFDNAFEISMQEDGSGFRSSTNYMLDVIPRNAFPTRENDHWKAFSYSWKKHSQRLENFYKPISKGLIDGSMRAGSSADTVCGNINAIVRSHYQMVKKVSQFRGISVSYTGEKSPELAVFGSVVVVPQIPNMEYIFEQACGGSLKQLQLDIEKSMELSTDEKIEAVRREIERVEAMKSADYDALIRSEMNAFVQTYASYLSSQGMLQGDAQAEARMELRKFMSHKGGAMNWTVPGMNTISDRIDELIRNSRLDYATEIERLKAIERKLLSTSE